MWLVLQSGTVAKTSNLRRLHLALDFAQRGRSR